MGLLMMMARYVADGETKDELEELHRSLHVARDMIHQPNYAEAESILRTIEARLAALIDAIKVVA
jgi:ABC-type cobalt transport system substrate-binding protein